MSTTTIPKLIDSLLSSTREFLHSDEVEKVNDQTEKSPPKKYGSIDAMTKAIDDSSVAFREKIRILLSFLYTLKQKPKHARRSELFDTLYKYLSKILGKHGQPIAAATDFLCNPESAWCDRIDWMDAICQDIWQQCPYFLAPEFYDQVETMRIGCCVLREESKL